MSAPLKLLAVTSAVAVLAAAASPAQAGGATTERRGTYAKTLVSQGRGGHPANGPSRSPGVSANARYVAYSSDASNLLPGDRNAASDVFRYDAETGRTVLVSRADSGHPARGSSRLPTISSSGRYVAYQSDAADLAGPTEQRRSMDVFRYDAVTRRTIRVSRPERRGDGYAGSRSASVSGDGRLVAYASTSSTIAGHDTNGRSDVFVFDAATKKTTRVSLRSDGSQRGGGSHDPALSANGRFVTYTYQPGGSGGRHPSSIYRQSLVTGKSLLVSRSSRGRRGNRDSTQATVSGDGRVVLYRSAADNLVRRDTNGYPDIFVFDTRTTRTALVSYADDGGPADGPSAAPALSRNGEDIAFQSTAGNLTSDRRADRVSVYGQYLRVGNTVLVSESITAAPPNGASTSPSISADGFAVAFASRATNIVRGGTRELDVFLRTRN